MRHLFRVLRTMTYVLLGLGSTVTQASPPKVVVSLGPLYSLTAGVMEGVASPILLVNSNHSPHIYRLRPSHAKAMQNADLIVWVGPNMETFLVNALKTRGPALLTLNGLDGLTLWPNRAAGLWGREHLDAAGHGHQWSETAASGMTQDPHLWMDPLNAIVFVAAIAKRLTILDPANAARYQSNLRTLTARIETLHRELIQALTPLKNRRYAVFHDSFQYWERRYGLSSVGAVILGSEFAPSAKRLSLFREGLRKQSVHCLFAEPQFNRQRVVTLIEKTQVRIGTVDPLGVNIEPGPTGYGQLLRANAEAFVSCLDGTS